MSALAIQADGLSKRYRIGVRRIRRHPTIREALADGVRDRWRSLRGTNPPAATMAPGADAFWALSDVSFGVRHGEVLGLIGRNGAGKSTLLKILSRITAPTSGRAEVGGRIGSLLEVGTGFHPELTGRDNVFLNGAILGMDRAYISRMFDEIVEFSGVEQFIDTPVKRYSSGMYLRLAFAVAAHLEPEILIVDEVLAVGDAEFQKKCLGKMGSVARGGRTVLFVSHSMNAIQALCSRCLLLEGGRIAADGPTREVVSGYFANSAFEGAPASWVDLRGIPRIGSGAARFTAARYSSGDQPAGYHAYPMGPLYVDLVIEAKHGHVVGALAVTLYDEHGRKLVNGHTGLSGQTLRLHAGRNMVRARIDAVRLNPGTYLLGLWLADRGEVFDSIDSAFRIDVVDLRTAQLGIRVRDDGIVPCEFAVLAGPEPWDGAGANGLPTEWPAP